MINYETKSPLLKIDPDFQSLTPPLNNEKYEQLEKSIIKDGCCEPIVVWENYIIDGHKRYEICQKYGIDFDVTVIALNSKEDAISWICSTILNNKELPENVRRYLIGKKYYAEKTVGITNITGINQHTLDSLNFKPHISKTAIKIGAELHLSDSTVSQYFQFANAIDRLKTDFPDFVLKILHGEIKISMNNLIELAKKSKMEILFIIKSTAKSMKISDSDITPSRKPKYKTPPSAVSKISVKDMPAFDPDAYVSSLTLTIPSWISNMRRTATNSDLNIISLKARSDLIKALDDLILISSVIKKILEEE